MLEKIPIDKIGDWKLKNKLKKSYQELKNIPDLMFKTIKPRKKKKALKKLATTLLKVMADIPKNSGEGIAKAIALSMIIAKINIVLAIDFKKPKYETGGIVPSSTNHGEFVEYGGQLKPKRFIKKGELVKITDKNIADKIIEIKLDGKTILKGVKHVVK